LTAAAVGVVVVATSGASGGLGFVGLSSSPAEQKQEKMLNPMSTRSEVVCC
jgi:hypothetical protein